MAWNESGNGRNPWERGGGDRQGPPDLDRIVRDWQQKLAAFLRGGQTRKGGGGGASGIGGGGYLKFGSLILLLWLLSGFYLVDDAERGVVLRFGAYTSTATPGLSWHLPWPIESVERVNVNEISPFNKQTRMLTADENIVDVDLVVQYQKAIPEKFLFS